MFLVIITQALVLGDPQKIKTTKYFLWKCIECMPNMRAGIYFLTVNQCIHLTY